MIWDISGNYCIEIISYTVRPIAPEHFPRAPAAYCYFCLPSPKKKNTALGCGATHVWPCHMSDMASTPAVERLRPTEKEAAGASVNAGEVVFVADDVRRAFELLDKDGSGSIDAEEVVGEWQLAGVGLVGSFHCVSNSV